MPWWKQFIGLLKHEQEAKQDISKQTSSVGWMVQLHGLTDSRPRFILDGKFLQQQSVLPGPLADGHLIQQK
ncbi:uncharacterized protein UV8b_05408 [Ustilaginoidea virens]|uniref:Uncharacterized protein n=1 Tax=Ustilaginoidea virens TaxID=1159556 RepID=A0A8E5HTM0_USTVR|nr:uncharacterized protein UV8b_05408 [Ustilaginoidea virens]QUC21165.1 hypothetical protein UV8b_05408 [Ustilaginoidea virens]